MCVHSHGGQEQRAGRSVRRATCPHSVPGRMVQPVRLAGVSPVQMGRACEIRDVKK